MIFFSRYLLLATTLTARVKQLLLLLLVANSFKSQAQYCPWDCSGMIKLKTPVGAKELVYKLNPALVDETNWSLTPCMEQANPFMIASIFLHYDDFVNIEK